MQQYVLMLVRRISDERAILETRFNATKNKQSNTAFLINGFPPLDLKQNHQSR